MVSLTLEEQRQIYSKDLAAYTLRQWNAVRRRRGDEPLKAEEDSTAGDSTNTTPDGSEQSATARNNPTPPNADGMSVHLILGGDGLADTHLQAFKSLISLTYHPNLETVTRPDRIACIECKLSSEFSAYFRCLVHVSDLIQLGDVHF